MRRFTPCAFGRSLRPTVHDHTPGRRDDPQSLPRHAARRYYVRLPTVCLSMRATAGRHTPTTHPRRALRDMLRDALLVGAGGFVGAISRYGVSTWVQRRAPEFPLGTLAVNVIGSLALGFLATLFATHTLVDDRLRLAATVGFLGAFTTFSTFSYETARLWEAGRWAALSANVALNVATCLGATVAGMFTARWFAS